MTDQEPGLVHIEFPDGPAWKGKVTVGGVVIPVSRVTFSADAASGEVRAVLEVPHVVIDAKVAAALVSVVEVDPTAPDNTPIVAVQTYRDRTVRGETQ